MKDIIKRDIRQEMYELNINAKTVDKYFKLLKDEYNDQPEYLDIINELYEEVKNEYDKK